jgi:hypothetical protein
MREDSKKSASEWLTLVGSAVRWLSLLAGGVALLLYTTEIKHFPEGVQLGEGLAFYFVSIGLVLAFIAYWIAVTALGGLLLRWPAEVFNLQRLRAKQRGGPWANLRTDFSVLWSFPMWMAGVLGGGFFIALLALKRPDQIWYYAAVVFIQGFILSIWLLARRRMSALTLDSIAGPQADGEQRRQLRIVNIAFIVMLTSCPALVGLSPTLLVDAAFRMAQLRKDQAEVHAKQPWAQRLADAGLKGHPSFLGPDHLRFDNVKVLLRSVGTKIVVELPQPDGGTRSVAMPSEAFHIE